MAIEPIKGFYVHDEETNTDGVARYDYTALQRAPSFEALAFDLKADLTKSMAWSTGYYNQSGDVVASSNYLHSTSVYVHGIDIVTYSGVTAIGTDPGANWLDANENFLSYYKPSTNGTYKVAVPTNAYYLRWSAHKNDIANLSITAEYPTSRKLNEIFDFLKDYNSTEVFPLDILPSSNSQNGVTFTWEEDVCTVSGTSTGFSVNNIYYNNSAIPKEIDVGEPYYVDFEKTDANIIVEVLTWVNGSVVVQTCVNPTWIFIPDNTTAFAFRLKVYEGRTVNGYISNIKMLSRKPISRVAEIEEHNCVEVFPQDVIWQNDTRDGVTFSWVGNVCTVNGTSTGTSVNNIWYNSSQFPKGIEAGKVYYVDFEKTDENLLLELLTWSSGTASVQTFEKPGWAFIPDNATGFALRIKVYTDRTVSGTIRNIKLYSRKPVSALEQFGHYVTFVDDDTWTNETMERYYSMCKRNGIKGSFAVITGRVSDGFVNASKFADYQDEGFSMCMHAHQQTADFEPSTRDIDACTANMFLCAREMRDLDIVNSDYWVAPGGHVESDIVSLAKQLGVKCLVSTMQNTWNSQANANRYFVKRVGGDSGLSDTLKSCIDAFAADKYGGWLIITTHFNSNYWTNQAWNTHVDELGYPVGYSEFTSMVEYVKNKGCTVVPFAEGYASFEKFFD